MDVAHPRSLGAAGAEIDRFIERRSQKGETDPAERDELWKERVKAHQERQREHNRWEWVRFFDRMAATHARLSEDYERRAEALCEDKENNGATA